MIHQSPRASNDGSMFELLADVYAEPLVSLLHEFVGGPVESYTSPYADTSFYCATWGTLFFPLGPLALTFGILAIREIRAKPGVKGFKRAIFGIVIGAIGTAILLAIAIAVLWRLTR